MNEAKGARKLLEDLPRLWEEANPSELRNLLLPMLDAVYMDTLEERPIVAVTHKPA